MTEVTERPKTGMDDWWPCPRCGARLQFGEVHNCPVDKVALEEPSIHQSMIAVMRDIRPVDKTDWNDFHKYHFRGIDRILDAVAPALRKHGVLTLPQLRQLDSRDVTTDKGKTSREVTLTVEYSFVGPAGDSISVVVPGESQDTGDKALSKAMSVAYRTALIQAFAIATGDQDPDSQQNMGRGSIQTAIRTVQELASSRGWSFDDLAHDFQRSQGGDIKQAGLESLNRYIEELDPTPATIKVARRTKAPTT